MSLRNGESGQNAVRHVGLARGPGLENAVWMKMVFTWSVLENFYRLRIALSELVQVCINLTFSMYVCAHV